MIQFDEKIAKAIGVNCAIIISNWHKLNKIEFKIEDKDYISIDNDDITKSFPFITNQAALNAMATLFCIKLLEMDNRQFFPYENRKIQAHKIDRIMLDQLKKGLPFIEIAKSKKDRELGMKSLFK